MPSVEITRAEALQQLGISGPTLRKFIANGTLTATTYAGKTYVSRESVNRLASALFAAQIAGVSRPGRPRKLATAQ
jgi:predicted site-specific integrase-resolvase